MPVPGRRIARHSVRGVLPEGVVVHRLERHRDDRGVLTEIFRSSWGATPPPVQWNLVHSAAGVLRGVHVHCQQVDHVVAIAGRFLLGVQDLRPTSPTHGVAALVDLGGDEPGAATIPPGVAHGFLFPVPTTFVYGLTVEWDSSDELGCRWDDPDLSIPWPMAPTSLSPRDVAAPPLASFAAALGERLLVTR